MKHIILSAILAVSAGVASAGSIEIDNNSWYAVNTFVRYDSSEGIQETVCTCSGEHRVWYFGDETAHVSIEPLSDLRADRHFTLGPNDHIRVDIAGHWFERPYYNVYNTGVNSGTKWTPPPKFGGL